ncbi:SEC-C metal-binding domain-containing protein, partial [uncultured Thiodictyon sp.]|uniref:SEC-C metal-binding domain-containing protein n=1 Tax=uncultured Thiodictyon sp. TaxID=1846217 RepID=UPI0025FB6881
MTMRGFYEVFPELADPDRGTVEMFMVELTEPWGEVPADSYCFMELYCDVPGCDCRRVSILVVSVDLENESAEVCLRLDGAGIFPGPYLDSLGPRPPHSQGLLELVKRVLERMPDYLPRLQRHYMMFKAHCEGRPYTGAPFPPKAPTLKALPGSAGEAPRHRVGRNAPCPCGLGRAYRQCCMTRLRPAPAGTNAAGIGPPATPQPG